MIAPEDPSVNIVETGSSQAAATHSRVDSTNGDPHGIPAIAARSSNGDAIPALGETKTTESNTGETSSGTSTVGAATPGESRGAEPSVFEHIRTAVRSLKFGQVTITIHDSQVVQVDCTERRRFTKPRG